MKSFLNILNEDSIKYSKPGDVNLRTEKELITAEVYTDANELSRKLNKDDSHKIRTRREHLSSSSKLNIISLTINGCLNRHSKSYVVCKNKINNRIETRYIYNIESRLFTGRDRDIINSLYTQENLSTLNTLNELLYVLDYTGYAR